MEIELSSVRIKFGGGFPIVFPKDNLSHSEEKMRLVHYVRLRSNKRFTMRTMILDHFSNSVVPNYSAIQDELKCTIIEAGMN